MQAKIQNTLHMIGKQIHDLRVSQMFRFSDQRAQLTWARVIESYDDLPEAYKESVKSLLSDRQAFPYTVLTPAYETFRSRVSEKLICTLDREIYVLERNGKMVTTCCYPIDQIQYAEVSSMLLDYRVRINGVTRQGVPASFMVRSSTATDYLFTPILRKIRLYTAESRETIQTRDVGKFVAWANLNFKFMNFARNSLFGGEKVLCAVLQPEIKTERFRFLGRTYYRTISPTHTCILTDWELIMIREESLQDRNDKYGGIWDFIPLSKIAALSISRKHDDLLTLSVKLQADEIFECIFQTSKASEVSQLPVRFHELTSR